MEPRVTYGLGHRQRATPSATAASRQTQSPQLETDSGGQRTAGRPSAGNEPERASERGEEGGLPGIPGASPPDDAIPAAGRGPARRGHGSSGCAAAAEGRKGGGWRREGSPDPRLLRVTGRETGPQRQSGCACVPKVPAAAGGDATPTVRKDPPWLDFCHVET